VGLFSISTNCINCSAALLDVCTDYIIWAASLTLIIPSYFPTKPLITALFETSQQGITAEVCLIIQDLK
jgi:hypothetical protein